MMGGGPDPKPEQADNETPIVDLTADELLAAAIKLFATNESKAIESFAAAASKDASVLEVASHVIGNHSNAVECLLQTNDGAHLVTLGYDKSPFIWKLGDGQAQLNPQKLQPSDMSLMPEAIALSPDGSQVLCGMLNSIGGTTFGQPSIWTINSGDMASTQVTLPKHEDEPVAVAWHPTENRFVVTCSADGELMVVELSPANSEFPHGSVARSGAFHVRHLPKSLTFDPTGEYLIMIADVPSSDVGDIQIVRWQEIVDRLDSPSELPWTAIKPAGTQSVCAEFISIGDQTVVADGSYDGPLTLWGLEKAIKSVDRYQDAHQGSVEALAVAHRDQGDILASCSSDGTISVWPVSLPATRKTFRFTNAAVGAIDISADGRWIATGSDDGFVCLWDHEAEQSTFFMADTKTVDSILVDSQGRWLIAGCGNGFIRVWDLVHCKLVALSTTEIKGKQRVTESQTTL